MAYKKKTKKVKRQVDSAVAHIKSTFNNTLVSITTIDGDVLLRNSQEDLDLKGHVKVLHLQQAKLEQFLQKKWQQWEFAMLK